jgi:hypothetical protein
LRGVARLMDGKVEAIEIASADMQFSGEDSDQS